MNQISKQADSFDFLDQIYPKRVIAVKIWKNEHNHWIMHVKIGIKERHGSDALVYLNEPMHKKYSSTFAWGHPFSEYVSYDQC